MLMATVFVVVPGALALTGQTLRYLNGHPGAANIDIARAVAARTLRDLRADAPRLTRSAWTSAGAGAS
ncbi:MAG: hypothetical protein ABW167_09420 [Baekduia sp.]